MAQRAGTQDTPYRFVVPRPVRASVMDIAPCLRADASALFITLLQGTYYFACPVDSHCEQGLKVRVVANAP